MLSLKKHVTGQGVYIHFEISACQELDFVTLLDKLSTYLLSPLQELAQASDFYKYSMKNFFQCNL